MTATGNSINIAFGHRTEEGDYEGYTRSHDPSLLVPVCHGRRERLQWSRMKFIPDDSTKLNTIKQNDRLTLVPDPNGGVNLFRVKRDDER